MVGQGPCGGVWRRPGLLRVERADQPLAQSTLGVVRGQTPPQLGHRPTTAVDDSVAVVNAGLGLVSTFIWNTSGRL